MKFRTSVLIVAVAAAATWALPGSSSRSTQLMAHEFLTAPAQTAVSGARIEPVQLALLFQTVR